MDFEQEVLTLHQLSLNAAPSYLWGSPRIRQEVRNFMKNYRNHDRKENSKIDIKSVMGKIPDGFSEILNHQRLPRVLKIKLQEKISEMREMTFDWILHLVEDFQLDLKYAEKIYWTSTGEIDIDKIFNSYWINLHGERLPPSSVLITFYQMLNPVYVLACCFAQEKFIIQHQEDIITELESISPAFKRDNNINVALDIMGFVICYFYFYGPSHSERWIPKASEKRTCYMMLCICKELCFHQAFVYFWKHTEQEWQQNFLEHSSRLATGHSNRFRFRKRNIFQLFRFVFDKMSPPQRMFFIERNYDFLFFDILNREPYKKYRKSLFEKYFLRFTHINWPSNLMHRLVDDLKKGDTTSDDSCFYFGMFEFIMKLVSKEEKVESFFGWNCSLLNKFINLFDVRFLKLIIDDKDLQEHRTDLIKQGQPKYKLLIEENNFQLLNEFMDEVLLSDEEKNQFKQDFNFLHDVVENCQYDVADNVLNWLHGDEAYKFKIRLIHLCCKSVPKNYDSIVKLLKWFFEAQDEPLMNSCKDRTKLLHDFCRELLYNVWFRIDLTDDEEDREPVVSLSTKILTFAFGTYAAIENFKINELAKEDCIKFMCDRLVSCSDPSAEANFSLVDEFLDFCAVPQEIVDDIKNSIADKIDDYVQKYGRSVERFDIVVPLLDWIYGNESYFASMKEETKAWLLLQVEP